MMEAVRTSETSVDNHFTRQYIPEDNSEHRSLVQFDLHCSIVAKQCRLVTAAASSVRLSVQCIKSQLQFSAAQFKLQSSAVPFAVQYSSSCNEMQ
jgi:hypothetical protein